MAADHQPPLLQACAVPFRKREEILEFCLITALGKRRWGFPKGLIDPGETAQQTALKEAHEEAGLHGHLLGQPLGCYDDFKWDRALQVTAWLMHVTRADDDWLEAGIRRRLWLPFEEARRRLSRDEHRRLLETALERLKTEHGG